MERGNNADTSCPLTSQKKPDCRLPADTSRAEFEKPPFPSSAIPRSSTRHNDDAEPSAGVASHSPQNDDALATPESSQTESTRHVNPCGAASCSSHEHLQELRMKNGTSTLPSDLQLRAENAGIRHPSSAASPRSSRDGIAVSQASRTVIGNIARASGLGLRVEHDGLHRTSRFEASVACALSTNSGNNTFLSGLSQDDSIVHLSCTGASHSLHQELGLNMQSPGLLNTPHYNQHDTQQLMMNMFFQSANSKMKVVDPHDPNGTFKLAVYIFFKVAQIANTFGLRAPTLTSTNALLTLDQAADLYHLVLGIERKTGVLQMSGPLTFLIHRFHLQQSAIASLLQTHKGICAFLQRIMGNENIAAAVNHFQASFSVLLLKIRQQLGLRVALRHLETAYLEYKMRVRALKVCLQENNCMWPAHQTADVSVFFSRSL